ncbi:hypothetical protein ZWY2020_023244 [Hordeum vulgare]|nr:hypothetical protein ZWY2020_023244 [Hordeum vulgare]
MSSASLGSSASRGRGIRRRGVAARSPVPYREEPMEYEPAICCPRCGKKAPRWISWSPANPGRRYYACVEAQHGFIQWHDGHTTLFLRVLLGDLRDRVWKLEAYIDALSTEGASGAAAAVTGGVMRGNEKNASVSEKCVSREMLLYGIVIFLSGMLIGMILG